MTRRIGKMTLTFNPSLVETSMLPFVIQTEEQYHQALAIAESLFFKQNPHELEEQIMDVWEVLIEIYEEARFQPGSASTPVSVLKTLMEARGLIQADLVRVGIGSSGIVSEIINGKRQISKEQAKKLAVLFSVSADLFKFPSLSCIFVNNFPVPFPWFNFYRLN
jgi:HTH-type transcriptional regulator/antitoxin HigA